MQANASAAGATQLQGGKVRSTRCQALRPGPIDVLTFRLRRIRWGRHTFSAPDQRGRRHARRDGRHADGGIEARRKASKGTRPPLRASTGAVCAAGLTAVRLHGMAGMAQDAGAAPGFGAPAATNANPTDALERRQFSRPNPTAAKPPVAEPAKDDELANKLKRMNARIDDGAAAGTSFRGPPCERWTAGAC